jgi:hypothetical protein
VCDSNVRMLASTYIELDEVEVPAENLIGKENEGFGIIMSSKLSPKAYYVAPSSCLNSLRLQP